ISIIYFRRHAGFLRSYWDEMVKHGETGSAEDWVATCLREAHGNYLNYCNIARRVTEVCGDDYIYFIAYDNVVANQEDLFSHFIEFIIGKRPASQTWDLTPGQRNLGANLRLREITRLLNHYVAEGGDTPGQWGRQYILANPNLLSELLPPD